MLCPWARHLTGRLHLYVADKWWGQAICPSWWPSLTEDSQTEPERACSVCTSTCIMLRTNSLNDEEKETRHQLKPRLISYFWREFSSTHLLKLSLFACPISPWNPFFFRLQLTIYHSCFFAVLSFPRQSSAFTHFDSLANEELVISTDCFFLSLLTKKETLVSLVVLSLLEISFGFERAQLVSIFQLTSAQFYKLYVGLDCTHKSATSFVLSVFQAIALLFLLFFLSFLFFTSSSSFVKKIPHCVLFPYFVMRCQRKTRLTILFFSHVFRNKSNIICYALVGV